MLAGLAARQLVWLPALGLGYYECDPAAAPYDADYFERYRAMERTPMGRRLIAQRVDWLRRLWVVTGAADVVDVGIGAGGFLEAASLAARGRGGEASGFDVNPAAQSWLREHGLWLDLYRGLRPQVATFWDSLEHISDPIAALDRVSHGAAVSIPIFRGPDHVLASRHFRPTEHYWYFTRTGFVSFVRGLGFHVLDILATETAIGREDIETFLLVRD